MEKLLTYVGDGMGMRVPYMLLLRGQSEFIDILSNELSKNVEIYDEIYQYMMKWKIPDIVLNKTLYLFFHLSSHLSDAWKFPHTSSFAKYKALTLNDSRHKNFLVSGV